MEHKLETKETFSLAFIALGIVFGDIGTSPVIALRQALIATDYNTNPLFLMGMVSLIFWALILVVCIKYLVFITRADNKGEGGVFALLALINEKTSPKSRIQGLALIFALIAASLLFADSLITPALSILAATEGLTTVYEEIDHWVVTATLVVLIALFSAQRFGTGMIGRYFGLIMLLWFGTIGVIGFQQIIEIPEVLQALSPLCALQFIVGLDWITRISVFGAVLLAVTGAEAIYADMGHFGRKSISIAWFSLAFGALTLNYLGQVAWLIKNPPTQESIPFFDMIPETFVLPMILLTTLAGVTASQAVISGMFSLTKQAIHLNLLPRLRYIQTSDRIRHQIYLPKMNLVLFLGSVLLVLIFRSSDALAGAYGCAVAATMLITTLSFCLVGHYVWCWRPSALLLFLCITLPLDMAFFAASLAKLPHGGFITAGFSLLAFYLMISWLRGNQILAAAQPRRASPLEQWCHSLPHQKNLTRLNRPAVYFQHLHQGMQGYRTTPASLELQVKLTTVFYSPSILVHFKTQHIPRVSDGERLHLESVSQEVMIVTMYFGFAETPTIKPLINMGLEQGFWMHPSEITYFSAQERLVHARATLLPIWMDYPYRYLHQFDEKVVDLLALPSQQYVELGVLVRT